MYKKISLFAAAAALCFSGSVLADEKKPNIIFIMADDLGNADLGYRGGKVITPNIDKLAQGGVRLESFYGQQVCTPARAALMTGRYPMRYGLQTLVIFPSHTYGLPTDERTLPQALKDAGYKTLMTGKWHLGHADKKFWPQNRGFDYFYGNVMGEVEYFTRERGGVIDWQRNGTFLKEEGYYTKLIGDEAVKLIDQQDGKQPFFLYFASLAPHAPYQAPQEYVDRYKSLDDKQRSTYSGMITALDDQIGRIVAELDKKGLRDNTIILFGKGGIHEGGVRVPAFVNWPARLKPHVVDAPLHMVDVMPTLLTLAGAKGSADHPFDGKDMWKTIADGAPSPNEDVLIDVEAFRGAIRKGDWKLIKIALLPGKTELFNLARDPGETTNVAEQNPDVVHDLETRLVAYAKQQKPSEWIKAQPSFAGAQGKTVFDPDFDIDDGGLPHEKSLLPKR